MAVLARKCAWAFALSLAVACSLPSNDEFTGGKSADLVPDASPDAGKTETLVDAGGSDATVDADAGAAACPSAALFCEGFESQPVKWTHDYDDTGLLTDEEGAPGRALGVKLGARDGTKSLAAFLEQSTSLEAKKPFTVSFDVNVSQVKNVGVIDFDCFRFHGPFASFGIRIANYGTGGVIHWYGDPIGAGDPVYDEVPVEALPPSQWVHIACAVTYPTADPSVRITFDGREVFNAKVPIAAYVGAPYLSAGVTKTEKGGPAVTLRFDNLVLTSP